MSTSIIGPLKHVQKQQLQVVARFLLLFWQVNTKNRNVSRHSRPGQDFVHCMFPAETPGPLVDSSPWVRDVNSAVIGVIKNQSVVCRASFELFLNFSTPPFLKDFVKVERNANVVVSRDVIEAFVACLIKTKSST